MILRHHRRYHISLLVAAVIGLGALAGIGGKSVVDQTAIPAAGGASTGAPISSLPTTVSSSHQVPGDRAWLPTPASARSLTILDHGLFRIGYDEQAKNPAWVSYSLTWCAPLRVMRMRRGPPPSPLISAPPHRSATVTTTAADSRLYRVSRGYDPLGLRVHSVTAWLWHSEAPSKPASCLTPEHSRRRAPDLACTPRPDSAWGAWNCSVIRPPKRAWPQHYLGFSLSSARSHHE